MDRAVPAWCSLLADAIGESVLSDPFQDASSTSLRAWEDLPTPPRLPRSVLDDLLLVLARLRDLDADEDAPRRHALLWNAFLAVRLSPD